MSGVAVMAAAVAAIEAGMPAIGTFRLDVEHHAAECVCEDGPGRCHGSQRWCDRCGDVADVCHIEIGECDQHLPCASCGRRLMTVWSEPPVCDDCYNQGKGDGL